jgi:hypothetical protein
MYSALVFLTMSLVVGDGTLLGYFIFYGKVHVLCLLYVVNSRIGLSEGAGGATTYVSTQYPLPMMLPGRGSAHAAVNPVEWADQDWHPGTDRNHHCE